MDHSVSEILLNPVIQYGFAGFCLLLLGIIVWLMRQLLAVLKQTNQIIAANTDVIERVDSRTGELLTLNRSLHDKLIARPCIAVKEQ